MRSFAAFWVLEDRITTFAWTEAVFGAAFRVLRVVAFFADFLAVVPLVRLGAFAVTFRLGPAAFFFAAALAEGLVLAVDLGFVDLGLLDFFPALAFDGIEIPKIDRLHLYYRVLRAHTYHSGRSRQALVVKKFLRALNQALELGGIRPSLASAY